MPTVYKIKPVSGNYTNDQIKDKFDKAIFISFEGAIQLFKETYNLIGIEYNPIGYRITEQDIEMLSE